MKTLVTHNSPDFDALVACWLIKRFLPNWQKALLKFVPAGSSLDNKLPDENSNIIHIDTGLGQFDHHQTKEFTSATKLVFQYLNNNHYIKYKNQSTLERIVNFVNQIDHFKEVDFPDPTSDRYDFCIYQVIEGLKHQSKDEISISELSFTIFDAIFAIFKNKIAAEDEIKKGYVFKSKWGKSLAMETKNEEALKLALKMRYHLVIRKDPIRGFVRIKTLPDINYDLTPLYKEITSLDKKATWFLHISKNMLLNGSSKNPKAVASHLNLVRLIEIIKKI